MAVGETARSGCGGGCSGTRRSRRCFSAGSNSGNTPLPGPTRLSDNLVLTAYGQFDFNRFKLPDGKTGLFETAL